MSEHIERPFLALFLMLVVAVGAEIHGQKLPDKFPTQYKGDSLPDIERFIGSGGEKLAKDEFETANEAAQRIDKLLTDAKVNGHSLTNVIVVFVPTCKYDAEAKSFECSSFKLTMPELSPSNNPLREDRRLFISNEVDRLDGLRWTWQIDSATARQVKADLRVAVVGRPEYFKRGLTLNLSQIALFNYSTGEVYKTLKLESKKANAESNVILQ